MDGRMHRFVRAIARWMALAGGAMLGALILLTCASIAGREVNELLQSDLVGGAGWARWLLDTFGIGAIDGDFELLEAGMAFAIFAFLPWTQITVGHAAVDVFADALPARVNRVIAALTEAVFAGVLILIAVQLWGGMETKLNAGQTTIRLQFPVWWSYALAMVPAALAAIVGVWCAGLRIAALFAGRDGPLAGGGAEH